MIIRDDEDSYFATFGLPIVEGEPTPDDPVPVSLVTANGKVKIGPLYLPADEEVIASAMAKLLK